MNLKTRFITLTALGLLVLVAFSGALPAAHAQSSPSVAVSLSDASVEQGTAITATMSFRGLTFDSDASTTDYTFRADVTGANDCEGGGLGKTRYFYRVDDDPEVRTGTVSASCPAGDYTIRATISTPQSVALAAATASFTVAAPAQAPTASPTASIALSPSDAVEQGTAITATMSFNGLASDSDASTTDYVFRADVVDADDCEGGGIGFDRYMYRVDQDPEVRTGTVSANCPAGAYTLRVSISSSDNTELASASAGFFILGAPVVIEPPTLTALSVSHGDPAAAVTLSPAFESGTLAYRAAVRVAQVTVAPTASDADATVAYLDGNGDAIADADANADGHQVDLDAGSNTVKVAVSKGGLTTTYTVKLFRLVTQQQTADVTLVSNTGQTAGTSSAVGANEWAHGFTTGSNAGGYNLSSIELDFHTVASELTSAGVTVAIWSATAADPPLPNAQLHTLSNPVTFTTGVVTFTASNVVLDASTTYFVHVANSSGHSLRLNRTSSAAEDSGAATGWSIGDLRYLRSRGTTDTFRSSHSKMKFAVKGSAVSGTQPPQSSDATLSELTLVNAADDAAIALTPTFVSGTESYTADVASAVAQVTVTATANHGSATFVITPTDANSGTAGHQVNLGVPGSDTVITVVVTAEDGSDKTYTVTVTRTAPTGGLTSLSVSPGTLSPTFARDHRSYRVAVENDVSQVTITTEGPAGVQVQFTKVNVVLADADAVTEGHQVDLVVGDNVISVIAVGPGSIIKTYVVTVARAAAVGVSLVTLNLDATTIAEDSGTAVNVTATLSAAKTTQFTVTVTAAPPAADGAYTLSSNTTLTFSANATESTGTVTITPVGNMVNERDKVITVSGAVAAGVTGVTAPADVTLTITDNDHPVITHTLTLHRNDAAKTLLDPTMIPENVGQVCVRVTATTESDLPPETDDRPTGSSRSDTAVSPGDFSAVSGQFYLPRSAYSLESGHHVAVRDDCAALRIVDDSVDEGNEQFALYTQQSPLTPQTYEFEFTPSNPLTVTIIDNDEASLSIADAGGAEGEDLEFTVTLDPTSVREVTVDWAVNDDSATAGADYTDGSGTLTFAPGDTTKTVTVATLQDTVPESVETFTVTLSNASNAAIGDARATGTIAADDEDVTVSTDATLKRLRLSHTNISDFDSETTSYSVSLADSVVTVTPTANNEFAAITVNGAQVASGSDMEVDLVLGANTVTIEVTAQDGIATKTYTVTVTRHECPGQEVAGEFVTDATGCPRLTLLETGKVRVEWDAVTSGTTVTVRYYLNFVVTKVNPNGTKEKGKWFTKSDHYSGVTDSDASLTGETFSNLPLEANVVYFSYQTDGSAWSPWSMIWIDPQ